MDAMTHLILYITGTLLFGGICFWMGKRSRRYPIVTDDVASALAYFQYKEKLRHRKDIMRINRDLAMLEKTWGIKPPKGVDADTWIEIKKVKA